MPISLKCSFHCFKYCVPILSHTQAFVKLRSVHSIFTSHHWVLWSLSWTERENCDDYLLFTALKPASNGILKTN